MPSWFFFALLGHLANGAAFIIDKTLLQSSFKRAATYASLIGMLSVVAIVLIPFGVHLPTITQGALMAVSGITFVISLWAFFKALGEGEASRVVPIIGSLIPIATLVGTTLFLGETLSQNQLIGFGLLLVATIILSGGGAKNRLKPATLGIAVLAAMLFAVSSITIKAAYDTDGFLTTFTVSRLFAALTGASLLLIDRKALTELTASFGKKKKSTGPVKNAFAWVLAAQVLGGIGFLGVQYATSLGSAALVNALQAVQYALLVLVAFVLKRIAPTLLGENLRPGIILQKSIAILLVAIGLWLVV